MVCLCGQSQGLLFEYFGPRNFVVVCKPQPSPPILKSTNLSVEVLAVRSHCLLIIDSDPEELTPSLSGAVSPALVVMSLPVVKLEAWKSNNGVPL